jgi:hypothetical protein
MHTFSTRFPPLHRESSTDPHHAHLLTMMRLRSAGVHGTGGAVRGPCGGRICPPGGDEGGARAA